MILSYKDNIPTAHSILRSSTQRPNQAIRNPLPSNMHAAENPLMYPTYTLARFSEFPRNFFFFFAQFCYCVVQTRPTKRYTFPECENEKKGKYSTTSSTGSYNSYVSPPSATLLWHNKSRLLVICCEMYIWSSLYLGHCVFLVLFARVGYFGYVCCQFQPHVEYKSEFLYLWLLHINCRTLSTSM